MPVDLRERIIRLEKLVNALIGALLASVTCFILLWMTSTTQRSDAATQSIEAKSIILRDSHGRVRCHLDVNNDNPYLAFLDSRGDTVFVLGEDDKFKTVTLSMREEANSILLQTRRDEGSGMRFSGPGGSLLTKNDRLLMFNSQLAPIFAVMGSQNGNPLIGAFDVKGNLQWKPDGLEAPSPGQIRSH